MKIKMIHTSLIKRSFKKVFYRIEGEGGGKEIISAVILICSWRYVCYGRYGKRGYGTTPFFELPLVVSKELLKGKGIELGDVMDNLIGEKNTTQKQGAVGYFTKGVMDRKEYYVAGLTVALIPFLNERLYFEV